MSLRAHAVAGATVPVRLRRVDTRAPVNPTGHVTVRVVPVEWTDSRPPFLRRSMRDHLYVESREKPLLDVVLFETFAGRGTGDNPGAV